MPGFDDAEYLKTQQYKNSGNYGVRVRFHERCSTNPYDMHLWCFDYLLANTLRQADILELGGGQADLWLKSRDRIPPDWKIVFSDFSPGMVDDAKARLGDNSARFADFTVIDAQSIPYEDHTFDAVIANMMLYHVPDRLKAIAEIRRVLKPDGKLYAMTLGEAHMRELYEWVRGNVPALNFGLKHTDNPFSLENGQAQLEAAFAQVHVFRYEDSIAVTEVPLFVEYIASLEGHTELLEDNAVSAAFKAAAQQALESDGKITSTKDVGLFIAQGER